MDDIYTSKRLDRGSASGSYNKDAVPPYQKEGADVLKPVTFWGDDVFVGNLEPGRYEIRIKYKYDCWNWGVNEWEPDESIQFTVE